ncbi:MAG TPA: O-antigen ligase family protein [Acidobacteriota bacterium]|nr:O-antigen ligase family protein [Acidobacteriota bacterium]
MIVRSAVAVAGLLVFGSTFAFFPPLAGLALLAFSAATYWRPEVGLSLVFLVVPFELVRPLPGDVFVSFSEFMLAGSAVAFFWRRPDWLDWDWRPLIWWTPFLGAILLSGLINIEWYKVLPHVLRNCELALMAVLALNVYRSGSGRRRWVHLAAGAALLFQGLLAVVQQLSEGAFGTRAVGTFSNPNQMGGFMALATVTALALWLVTQDAAKGELMVHAKRVLGLGALAGLLGLLLSASRSALASASGGALVTLAGLWRVGLAQSASKRLGLRRIVLVLTSLLLLTVVFAQLPLFQPAYRTLSERVGPGLYAAAEKRLSFFEAGFKVWSSNPLLGVGPGRWREEALAHDVLADPALDESILAHPHNLLLQVGALFGLLGVLGLLYAGVRYALFFRVSSSPFALAGWAFLAVFVVNNLADSLYPSLAVETGWFLGALAAFAANRHADAALHSQA